MCYNEHRNHNVSVIVASYNNGKYLEECLYSIVYQSYDQIEIIVSDDASTDHSTKIIRHFEQKYPNKVFGIYNKTNNGVARNRDIAIRKASGPYITTLDADDYFAHNEKIKNEMDVIKKHKELHCKNVISFSNIILLKPEGKKIILGNKDNIKEGNILKDIVARNCMIPRDFVFLKTMYEEIGGYDFSLKIYEDWDLKIRLSALYPFYYSGNTGVVYRRHGKGLSAANKYLHIETLERIFRQRRTQISSCLDYHGFQFVKENFANYITTLIDQGVNN